MYKIINKKKLIATIGADIVGSVIFGSIKLLKQQKAIITENVRKILVIRTAYMGDVVMTLPILKPLKEKFSDSAITFLTAAVSREVLVNNPYIDHIMTYDPFCFYPENKNNYFQFLQDLRKLQFDLIIEARADIRELLSFVWPAKAKYKVSYGVGGGAYLLTHVVPYTKLKHKVEYHLDLARYLGCQTNGIEWGIYLTDDEKKAVTKLLREHQIHKPFICVHPGGRLPLKRWLLDRCARLYDTLMQDFKIPLVLVSSKEENTLVNALLDKMKHTPVVLAGKLNLRTLAGVLAESKLFVCHDSGPMHIAAAMRTPTVAIFGPSKSQETGPYGNLHKVVEKDFPCRFTCDENTCRHSPRHACMVDIGVDDVYQAVKELWEETMRIV